MLGIFLDSETNGLDPQKHHVVEIAFQIVDILSGEVKEKYEAVISHGFAEWENSDKESLKINGFTWEKVSRGKPKKVVSQEIIDLFTTHGISRKKAVFICQNPSFDRAFFSQLIDPKTQDILNWPYHWLDLASMHWALSMESAQINGTPLPWEAGLSKDKIAHFHQIEPEQKPHRAMNGVAHLIECYRAVVGFPKG